MTSTYLSRIKDPKVTKRKAVFNWKANGIFSRESQVLRRAKGEDVFRKWFVKIGEW